MARPKLSKHAAKTLSAYQKCLEQMKANAKSHGSLHPKVTGKATIGWLEKALDKGSFIRTQTIGGKTYQLSYQGRTHFKTGALLVDVYAQEMLGKGKLGKSKHTGNSYKKLPSGIWVKTKIIPAV